MNKEQRANLLKDEYIMLQQFYEDMDAKALNIKNWAITVAVATIGAGVLYGNNLLLFVAFLASLVFWYLEAHWRGLSHFFVVRINEIEAIVKDGKADKAVPLQVYTKWEEEYARKGDQTFRYMLKTSSIVPHAFIAGLSLFAFMLGIYGLLK
jgi:hypothetical protein